MKDSVQITMRVNPSVVERADALVSHLTDAEGHPVVRTDVFRKALMLGLAELESRARSAPRDEEEEPEPAPMIHPLSPCDPA